jgi:hypothetical protein
MPDFHFYQPPEPRRAYVSPQAICRCLVAPFRWAVARLLLPVFQRQANLFQHLDTRIEELRGTIGRVDEIQAELRRLLKTATTAEALSWDQVASARRLAALEDHVETLLQRSEVRSQKSA